MRAVVDNNLLVSGLLWGDKPGRLLNAVADGSLQLFLSEPLLAELGEVLHRDKFAARLALKHLTPGEHLIRHYGWYSNKSRGQRAQRQPSATAGTVAPARPPTAREARKG